MDIAQIRVLQEEFNRIIREHEIEDVRRGSSRNQGNSAGETQNMDRMKQLGALAMDTQRRIGELMREGQRLTCTALPYIMST